MKLLTMLLFNLKQVVQVVDDETQFLVKDGMGKIKVSYSMTLFYSFIGTRK